MHGFALGLLAIGCAYQFTDFAGDLADAQCSKLDECEMLDFYGGTYETCVDSIRALTGGVEEDDAEESCPNYDKDAAKDCVADWESLTCAQLEDGQTPEACDQVCSAGSDA